MAVGVERETFIQAAELEQKRNSLQQIVKKKKRKEGMDGWMDNYGHTNMINTIHFAGLYSHILRLNIIF
ncbi:hypothetical protein AYI70_g10942 [Smittium culicis]|uniref:Uncharacterized protein n=1 Tax=Smittium culicis TaxID=133412 RepID=A0A1R1X448_9FUNG|nr:hypothetical protein AYI70_g10942 [Smittium culicis]